MGAAWADGVTVLAADSSQVLPARQMMAFTLGFHIILVPFGVAFTAIMLIANYRGIRHGDRTAMLLARRWSMVAGVLFAVGAVSGTVLSFELGLLWPGLMGRYGAAFGIPFAVEGLFFFVEAIFVAIYIYGWNRMRPWPHFWSGVPIVLSGIGGTSSVVAANAWMNSPAGITVADGRVVDVRPLRVFFNDAFWYEALHMLLAAYMVAGFVIAGVYAVGMLRGRRDRLTRLGLAIPFTVAAIATPVQFFVGDVAAREVYQNEPAKFAAIEAVPTTASRVPEVLGGALVDGQVRYGIEIPLVASMLAGYSPDTEIQGLDAIPADERPADRLVNTVHLAFQVMVGIGTALLGLAAWGGVRLVAAPPAPGEPAVPALHRGQRRRRRRGAGVRLGGHRGGPPTVDRPRAAAHGGRRASAGQRVALLHRDRGALRSHRVRHVLRPPAAPAALADRRPLR